MPYYIKGYSNEPNARPAKHEVPQKTCFVDWLGIGSSLSEPGFVSLEKQCLLRQNGAFLSACRVPKKIVFLSWLFVSPPICEDSLLGTRFC